MNYTLDDLDVIFSYGNTAFQVHFIKNCPDIRTKNTALRFIELAQPNSNLAALDALCTGFNGTSDSKDWGVLVAKTLIQQGRNQYYNLPDKQDEALSYAMNGLHFHTKFLFDAGDYDGAILSADDALEFIIPPQRFQFDPLSIAQLYKVESLLAQHKFETAQQAFAQLKGAKISEATQIQYDNLQRKITSALEDATGLTRKNQIVEESEKGQKSVFDWVQNMVKESPNNPSLKGFSADFDALLDKIEQKPIKTGDANSDVFNESKSVFDVFYDMFTNRFGNNDLHGVQKRNLAACSVFQDPKRANDAEALEQSLSEFMSLYKLVKEKQIAFDTQDLLWSMCICYNRLQRFKEGSLICQQLWVEVEQARQNISDYFKRAGLLNKYPYLFTRLCDFFEKTGDSMGMLRAIESSKGRVLADVLDKQMGETISVNRLTDMVAKLPNIMKRNKSNYLSFLFEEDYGFAVLVAENGQIYNQKVPIGSAHLSGWLNDKLHDPDRWKQRSTGLFARKVAVDITSALSPLVNWLQPLVEQGVITEGGHICYCPDSDLHLFPLHYIQFRGKYMIEQFTISRTQGVFTLWQSLTKTPIRPKRFVGIAASAKEDNGEDEASIEKRKGIEQALDFLGKILRGVSLVNEASDLQNIKNQQLSEAVIHFTAHGRFPHAGAGSPYSDSGLLIFDKNTQPCLDQQIERNLLSPKRLLGERINCYAAHVSLQACVSSRAKEGIGGDALGLEWAFLLSGASSLLSANWDVDYRYAVLFCNTFYDYWLLRGASRAKAFQQTCLDLMHSDLPTQHAKPFYWAAFSLTGDWR